ncbi:hypothetical protein FOZ60_013742 [Perkinsus olseni]|uniref:Uncharacterized protein n=1 Tax=Perkinsus olseni TaxID=32597 RepID=A0A7J6N8T9_PEROL|nr:hypothetical protein FOZ60_013742 [Perkinsus olseni]
MSVLQQLKMYCSKALRYLGLGPATTVAEYLLWDPGTPVATRPVYDPGSDMFANPGQSHDRHSQALATAPALSARSTPRWVYAASKSALRRCVVAYGSPFADKEFMSLVAGWCPGPDEVGLGLIMAVHGAEVVPTFGPDLGSHIERSDSFNFLASTFYYPESGVLFCNACRSLFKVTGVQSVSSVSALLGQSDDEAILDRLVRRVVNHSTGQHLSLFRSLGKKSAQLLFYLDHPGLIGVTVDGLRGFRPGEKDIPPVLRRLLLSLDRLEAKFGQKFGCTVQPRIGRLICWTDAASLRRLVPSSQEPLLGPGQCPFDRELNKILQGLSQAGRAYSECARFEARPVAYPRPAADEPSSSSSSSTVPPAPARSSAAVATWAREVAPLFRPSKPQHPPRLPPPQRPPPRLPVVTAIGPASSAPPGTGTSTSSRHDTAAPVPVASSTSSSVSSFVAPADPGWTVPSSASSLSSQPALVDLLSTEEFASCPFPVLAVDGPEDGQVRNDERGSFVAVPRPDYGIVPSDDDDIQGWLIDPETFFSPTTSPRASDEASVSSFVVPSTEVSVTLTEGTTDTRPVPVPSSTSTSFRADVSRYVTDTDMKASIRAAGLRVPPLTPADVFAPKVYATCDFLPHGQGQFRNVWWVEDYRLPMRDSDEAPRIGRPELCQHAPRYFDIGSTSSSCWTY